MDVKTTFLHGDLEEEIYMKQLEGFAVKGKKEMDSKLVKVPIPVGVKLAAEQCPKTQEEEDDMSRVPYASAVDCAGDLDQKRSTSVYVFNLFGGAVSWMSKKQSVVALSTTEAEYMATTHASKERVWLQRLCSSIGLVQGAIRIDCDSQSTIFLVKNPAYHSKTKHIDVQYHFVRDMIEDKRVLLVKVETLKNTVDALTKSVSFEKFS
eukprot:PITA_31334